MRLKLYEVHGSHPCEAVRKALELKGLPYDVVELPPAVHAPIQRVIFGARTVPGMKIDGEKVQGSRTILRRLEQLQPEPALLPQDPDQRARVEEAERWGDEVFQPIGRELIWAGLVARPGAMASYAEHSKLPMPTPFIRAIAPGVARIAARVNKTDAAVALQKLEGLPPMLDKIDGWIAAGVMGDGEHPNVADLQIASTLRLMMTLADVRPLIEHRPCGALALGLFPVADGDLPAGALSGAAA